MNQLDQLAAQLIRDLESRDSSELVKQEEYTNKLSLYLGRHNRRIEDDNTDIIPREFTTHENTEDKIRILEDCLEKNIDIDESVKFIDIQEGVVPLEEPPTKGV